MRDMMTQVVICVRLGTQKESRIDKFIYCIETGVLKIHGTSVHVRHAHSARTVPSPPDIYQID